MADRVIADLASAVADREEVDWPTVRGRLRTPHDGHLAAQLETLARLADPPGRLERRRHTRLSPVLEGARALAIACTAVGGAGEGWALTGEAPPGFRAYLVMLAAFSTAAVFLDVGRTDRRARALAACYWTVAASFGAQGILWLSAGANSLVVSTLAAVRPESFFSACLWQFAREFPLITRFSRLDRGCRAAVLVTTGLGLVLLVANLTQPFPTPDAAQVLLAALRRFPSGSWFWPLVFGTAVPALLTIAYRARAAAGDEKRRARVFLLAFVGLFGVVVIEVLAEALIPAFGGVMRTPTGRWWGGLVIYTTQSALPLVTAHAVLVSRVLDFKMVVQQGLRYLLARAAITCGAVVPPLMLAAVVYRRRDESLSEIIATDEATVLLWVAAAAVVLLALRPRLVRALDRWALPGSEAAALALARLSDELRRTRTPLEVCTAFATAADRALQAPALAYSMRGEELVSLRSADPRPPRDSVLPVLLGGERRPCSVGATLRHSYYPLVSEEDRAWIDAHDIAMVAPVFRGSTQDGLAGLVALKHRRNALAFSDDDVRFLAAGSGAASLACDMLQAKTAAAGGLQQPEELATECVRCGRIAPAGSNSSSCDCGGSWAPAALPHVIGGRLHLTRRLGAGGMGVVYRATDASLGRDVAIKTLTRLTEEAAGRLTLEARTMAGLTHSHIAVLYGTDSWRGTPLLIMEHMAGGTLAARLRRGPLGVPEAVRVVSLLATALEHVHAAGLIHGDIKPSNIGFTQDGTPKYLDFGLTRAVAAANLAGSQLPVTSTVIAGTPAYLSPEVRDGAPADPGLDLWALCLVLWESVTGQHPLLAAGSLTEIDRAISAAAERLAACTGPEFAVFLVSALAENRERRPQTAQQLLTQLRQTG